MDKIKIIVVEDNIVYCEFVCNLLAREGFRTVQAFHLSTARKLLQQAADGDIVVSDLRLPDGNGIDLLRWMRKEGMTQPFIIMTDYAEVHTDWVIGTGTLIHSFGSMNLSLVILYAIISRRKITNKNRKDKEKGRKTCVLLPDLIMFSADSTLPFRRYR